MENLPFLHGDHVTCNGGLIHYSLVSNHVAAFNSRSKI